MTEGATPWAVHDVQPGDTLIAIDAAGEEHEAQAVTGMWTSQFADFTRGYCRWLPGEVVTVRFTTADRKGIAWPVGSLRPRG